MDALAAEPTAAAKSADPASTTDKAAEETDGFNIADRLRETATSTPCQRAVVVPREYDEHGSRVYGQRTFAQLNSEADAVARGLIELGLKPGDRIALFVPPGLELLSLVFGLFRTGATVVLIDPGMGVKNLVQCLEETDPAGFVAVPKAHAARLKYRKRVPHAKLNVCVGRGAGPLGVGYDKLLARGKSANAILPTTQRTDTAAVIFTSGSTGPPKGVVYEHGMFDAQWQLIQNEYSIEPGQIDLPAFPLFGLFNVAMGVTTVVPEMDFTRPADVDPKKIVEAINDHGVTQCFGSPAFWRRVGRYCVGQHTAANPEKSTTPITLPSLKRALSAGAPVPPSVLEDMRQVMTHTEATFHTPYGATESLPACTITGEEVLEETAAATRTGQGTCVGTPFTGIRVKVIQVPDRPVSQMVEVTDAPVGEIGEILVSGPSVTTTYFERPVATNQSKIRDESNGIWHRIGDVGYFDDRGRLWFCGRKNHVVQTATGPLYPVQCEAIFNEHPRTARCALVGIKPRSTEAQQPVLVVEPEIGHWPRSLEQKRSYIEELTKLGSKHPKTDAIARFVFLKKLPVDTRHNVKINREELGQWAASQELYSATAD